MIVDMKTQARTIPNITTAKPIITGEPALRNFKIIREVMLEDLRRLVPFFFRPTWLKDPTPSSLLLGEVVITGMFPTPGEASLPVRRLRTRMLSSIIRGAMIVYCIASSM